MTSHRDPSRVESTLERNLRALLQRAYRPIEASPTFRETLRARVIEEAQSVFGPRRLARVRTWRLAAAAVVLVAAGVALAAILLDRGGPAAERHLASVPERFHVESGEEMRIVDVPGGRLELLPHTSLEMDDLGAALWRLSLGRGEARLHRDDTPEIGRLRTEAGDVLVVDGRGRFDLWLARTDGDETMKWNRVLIPAGVGAGVLIVYLAVHDGAVEIQNARGSQIVLPGESAVAMTDRAPKRLTDVASASAVLPGSPAASEASIPRGSVVGLVRDVAGRAIASALVEAGHVEALGPFVASETSISTGENGSFRLRLEAGAFHLRCSADGFATRLSDEIRVEAGTEVTDVVIELFDGGAISGRVTDDTGAGVDGATIHAEPMVSASGGFLRTAQSDASGSYTLSGAAAEVVYLVTASKADHEPARAINVKAHAAGVDLALNRLAGIAGRVVDDRDFSPVSAFRVTLQRETASYDRPDPIHRTVESKDGSFRFTGIEPGDYSAYVSASSFATRTVSGISVAPAHVTEGILARLERGGGVRGRVVSKDGGAPVEGAVVYSTSDMPPLPFGESPTSDWDSWGDFSTITGADGTFELSHVSDGVHSIAAEHLGFAPDRKVSVTVASGQVTEDVTLRLSSGGAIAGTVTDASEAPVKGALLFALEVGRDARDAFLVWGETDAEGRYRMPRAMPANYVVCLLPSADASEYAMKRNASATVTEGQTAIVDFREAAMGARLFGVVNDPKGKPLPQIWITAVRVGGTADSSSDIQFKSGVTNAEGQYEVREMKPGTYAIYLQQGFQISFAYAGVVSVAATPEDIQKDFTFSDAAISGIVRDSGTGAALGGASVILNIILPNSSNPIFAGRTQTDAGGAFRLQGLQPGQYQVVVMTAGFGQESIPSLQIAPDQKVSDLEFRLERGGSLLVRTAQADGTPVESVFVLVQDSRGVSVNDMSAIPKTNRAGEYLVPGLKPGRYSIRVVKTGFSPGVHPIDVAAGEQATATITLGAASGPAPADR